MNPWKICAAFLASLFFLSSIEADVPDSETAVIKFFQERGDRVTTNDDGHAVKLFSGGKPNLTVAELQSIEQLSHLEELALNAAPAGDEEWAFLQQLENLKKLTIWHGHAFSTLEPFCGLPVESILFGGCMGLRNLNQETPQRQRDAVLSLRDLPNLKQLTLYHSPLTPDDVHLAHIVSEFPHLTELRLDFAAPRGQEIRITADGLAGLAKLKLTKLAIENADEFSPEVFVAIGKIGTLESLQVYPAKRSLEAYNASKAKHEALIAELKKQLPDLEVTWQDPPKPRG